MICIELTRGYTALIDDEDAHLAEYDWCALVTKTGLVYAQRKGTRGEYENGSTRPTFLLHRQVVGATDRSQRVDHLNGDTLDNRRANLLLADHAHNMRNTGRRRNNVTGVPGVQFHKRLQRFQVFMQVNGKNTYFGSFDDLEAAAAHRRALEAEHWGGQYPRRAA
jgi:hypothetical protein